MATFNISNNRDVKISNEETTNHNTTNNYRQRQDEWCAKYDRDPDAERLRLKFFSAIMDNRMDDVRELARKVGINRGDVWGNTGLMMAVQFQQEEPLKFLLDNGANPHQTTNTGRTAYIMAEMMGWTRGLEMMS